ncbi:hypothetical protein ACQY0O_002175 [Thecaphora frezii]
MFHPRGFAPHENQPFAAQMRTPASSRSHLSPTRNADMTTTKRALGEKSQLFGQQPGSLGPKQLFKELASKTPARALGDRTNKNTRNRQDQDDRSPVKKGQASPSKGQGSALLSPTKGGRSVSPKKIVTHPSRILNVKMKENTPAIFSRGDQPYATDMDAMATPAPSGPTLKGRMLSRQTSFVTPAANIGKAGQIKARMGEMLDAELGINVDDMEAPKAEQAQAPKELTEEELYPEIEYMPPSTWATNPPYEYPSELDGVPRAKELAEELAAFRPAGFLKGVPAELSDPEETHPFKGYDADTVLQLGPAPALSDDGASDDDFWPDVPAPSAVVDKNPRPGAILAGSTLARRSAAPRATAMAPAANQRAPADGMRTSSSVQSNLSGISLGSSVKSTATTSSVSGASRASAGISKSSATRPATSTRVGSALSTTTTSRVARPAAATAAGDGASARSTATVKAGQPTSRAAPNSAASVARRAGPLATTKPSSTSTQPKNASLKRSFAPPSASSIGHASVATHPSVRAPTSALAVRKLVAGGSAGRAAKAQVPRQDEDRPKKQINAKLCDLANDDLGRFVEKKLFETANEVGFEGFDLGPGPDEECEPEPVPQPQPQPEVKLAPVPAIAETVTARVNTDDGEDKREEAEEEEEEEEAASTDPDMSLLAGTLAQLALQEDGRTTP